MASNPVFAGTYRSSQTQLVAAHGTRPRPIWTPGANGSRIHAINIATDDSTSGQVVTLYRGVALTLGSNMGTAAITQSPDTITRSAGSFVTDGWLQNQRLFVLGSTTLANAIAAYLTAVAAGTLTITTGTFAAAESFPSTGQLIMASILGSMNLPASSGTGAAASVSGLNPAQLAALFGVPDNFLTLGESDMLLASVANDVASDKSVDIVVDGADY